MATKNKRMNMETFIDILPFFVLVVLLAFVNISCASMFFSNSDYSDSIEIRPYLMNSKQIASVFRNTNYIQTQSPYKDLDTRKLYLVIMLKNKGNKAPWGTLRCAVDQRKLAEIDVPLLPSNMDYFVTFVVPVYDVILLQLENKPLFEISWNQLNAK